MLVRMALWMKNAGRAIATALIAVLLFVAAACAGAPHASPARSALLSGAGEEWQGDSEGLRESPAWIGEGDQDSTWFGCSVATAGDVDGDGHSDVIVGAFGYDGGQMDEGRAYLYLGTPEGLENEPMWTAEGDQADAWFGFSVATAGDVNGDGYDDVLVGAPKMDAGQTDEGLAYLYLGSATGLGATPAWQAEINQADARFGRSVATAGDVNGDGYSDVLIGAPHQDGGQIDAGRVYLYLGSPAGLSATPAWNAGGGQAGMAFGWCVATAGDVNADGYSDVVIGAPLRNCPEKNEGRAYVYLGSPSGLETSAAWQAEGDQESAQFGYSVAMAGDVNSDGYCDVVVGAPWYDDGQTDEGRAYIYHGSASGLDATPAWIGQNDQAGSLLGFSVAPAGDVHGDGFSDVLIGAPYYDLYQIDRGRATVAYGSATGIQYAGPICHGEQAGDALGYCVATAGDTNGDGFNDILVAAPWVDAGQIDEGQVYLYLGAGGLPRLDSWLDGDQADAQFGHSVATAGDVNGDGYSDVLIGAPYRDGSHTDAGRVYFYPGSATGLSPTSVWDVGGGQAGMLFGWTVATAGDVNGDGYSDVVIGAPLRDCPDPDEGRAYLYLGSPNGPGASAAWQAEGDQEHARFGYSVATAGDVNGDGYSDVLVGAPYWDGSQVHAGRACLYLGSASGLGSTPIWQAEGSQASALFGYCVAPAGDVDGDGYSDVLIGAPYYDGSQIDAGAAYLYLGCASGLEGEPAWQAQGDQAGAVFGSCVATAGDVNGDGHSDAVIGAPLYDPPSTDKGRALLYLGGPSGLGASAAWMVDGEGWEERLGISVATAGDVNADGYSDVIVGAAHGPLESDGATAYVFCGSALGLGGNPDWLWSMLESLDCCVACAGDVDANGFSDLVFGVPEEHPGGLAVTFISCAKPNSLPRFPRQLRTDGTTPIHLLGNSDSPSEFRVSTLGRTPAGRGLVRMVWEAKPLGTLLDGTDLGIGPLTDTGVPVAGFGSVVPLNDRVSGLAEGTPYHWRLRTVSRSPFFPRTPWFSMEGSGWQETDLRTARGASGVADDEAGQTAGLTELRLEAARPNPFAPHTRLVYRLPRSGHVRLAIFDAEGRHVIVLVDEEQAAGAHAIAWDGRGESGGSAASGAYFARLEVGGDVQSTRLLLTR